MAAEISIDNKKRPPYTSAAEIEVIVVQSDEQTGYPGRHPFLSMEELERLYTKLVLERTVGNRTEAARLLGIGVSTLWRHLKMEKPE